MQATFSKVRKNLAWGVFGLSHVQLVLIGLSVFNVASSEIHAYGGLIVALASLLMSIAAIIAKAGGKVIGLSFLLTIFIFPGQGFLIHMEGLAPMVRALHPVAGLTILWLGYYLAKVDTNK